MKRLLGVVFLPMLVAGCLGGAGSHDASTTSSLVGESLVGGVAQYAAGTAIPPNGNVHPYNFTTLVVFGHTSAGIRLLRLVGTNGFGRFALRLPPGRYLVELRDFHPAHTRFTVLPGQVTSVRLVNNHIP